MTLLYIFLIIINATGFLLMHIDKHRARNNLWRISESTFLVMALIGGSIGCLAGMYTARHKTKHPKFTIGIPFIISVQIVSAVILYSILPK